MGGTQSVTLSHYFMDKMEKDVVIPLKLKFYCRYVDEAYNRRNANQPDELFGRMNKYHPDINFTVEVNPSKFLDTRIYRDNNEIKCIAYHTETKLLFQWTSAVPKHCRKNVSIGNLHRVKNLPSNLRTGSYNKK